MIRRLTPAIHRTLAPSRLASSRHRAVLLPFPSIQGGQHAGDRASKSADQQIAGSTFRFFGAIEGAQDFLNVLHGACVVGKVLRLEVLQAVAGWHDVHIHAPR